MHRRSRRPRAGEGECASIKFVENESHAGSFRHASRATFLPEEGYVITRVYEKGVRKNSRTPFVVGRGR